MRKLFLEILVAVAVAVWCVWQFKPLAVDRTAADSTAAANKAAAARELSRSDDDSAAVARPVIHYPGSVVGRTFASRARAPQPEGKPGKVRVPARHLMFDEEGAVRLEGDGGVRTFRCVWRDPANVVFVGGDTVFDAQYDSTSGVLTWRGERYDIQPN